VSGRTLPPSPRRLREARRRGDVPVSRALVGLGATSLGLAALAALGPALFREEAPALRVALASAVSGAEGVPSGVAVSALFRVARLSAAPALAAFAGALLAGVGQTGGLLAPEAIRPRWVGLHPGSGMRRLFSPAAPGQAAFTFLVSGSALALGLRLLAGRLPLLSQVPRMRAGAAWAEAAGAVGTTLPPILALLAAAGLADLLLRRRRHLLGLRMTRSERERDQREDDGDPRHRAERRRLHASLARAPARPTCLVVNPTRLAVALAHRRGGDDPPVVLGKGSGARALALRREARRLGIPIVQDRALARALFRLADVGEAIPEELYEATATVLAHVHGLGPGGEA
jgi:type III secretion protein U